MKLKSFIEGDSQARLRMNELKLLINCDHTIIHNLSSLFTLGFYYYFLLPPLLYQAFLSSLPKFSTHRDMHLNVVKTTSVTNNLKIKLYAELSEIV